MTFIFVIYKYKNEGYMEEIYNFLLSLFQYQQHYRSQKK
jgi:hypothetical protein